MKRRSIAPVAATRVFRAVRALTLALAVVGCTEQLDAGRTRPHGLLPVDERNPIILLNDGAKDNWAGEYAVLLANAGAIDLAAIVVSASPAWPKIEDNVDGFTELLRHARDSGLKNLPETTTNSFNSPLKMPDSGKEVEDTSPYRSAGAVLIKELSAELALPYRPVVVVTGGALTDVANAYLLDPTVVDRVVVISSLGALDATGAAMAMPNGEMDPWADLIVATKFRYIQVSAYYDQLADVPDPTLLPMNPFGDWMRDKQPRIFDIAVASDQVALLAAALPGFVEQVQQVSAIVPLAANSSSGPHLTANPNGPAQLVTDTAGALASARLWQLLKSAFSK